MRKKLQFAIDTLTPQEALTFALRKVPDQQKALVDYEEHASYEVANREEIILTSGNRIESTR